jgi:phosphoglycolate phosphatase-like HAD superfamily hydrolase
LMLKKLEITADEAIYIWDSESDFLAAQAADMRFILFPKREIQGVENSINTFEELPEMIKQLDK